MSNSGEIWAQCPWCYDETGLSLVYFGQPATAWSITCLICGCEGPRRVTCELAAKAWNDRKTEPPATDKED